MEKTLAIIKPDAVAAGNATAIMDIIEKHDFGIIKTMITVLTEHEAEQFYLEHKDRPFYRELVEFMTSGEVVVMVLECENAVLKWRDLMGATNPAQAADGTIRKLYGSSMGNNATHGSDSLTSSAREIAFFFPHL